MHRMPDGTMMKGAKHGYKHGGVTKKKVGMKDGGMANCGASMKPAQKATPKGGQMNMGGYMTRNKPGMNCGGMPHKKGK